jgi:hypothetical protein
MPIDSTPAAVGTVALALWADYSRQFVAVAYSDGSIYRKYRDISPISILSVSYRINVMNIGFLRFIVTYRKKNIKYQSFAIYWHNFRNSVIEFRYEAYIWIFRRNLKILRSICILLFYLHSMLLSSRQQSCHYCTKSAFRRLHYSHGKSYVRIFVRCGVSVSLDIAAACGS